MEQLPEPTLDIVRLLPSQLARQHGVVPITIQNGFLLLACQDASLQDTLQDLMLASGYPVHPLEVDREQMDMMLERWYPPNAGHHHQGRSHSSRQLVESPAVRLVNDLLTEALHQGVSDIHVEPYERELIVRFRIDGVMKIVRRLPARSSAEVISRLQVMSNMDIAEKRRPQDGRLRVENGTKPVDVRVSALPTEFGLKIVLRLLDRSAVALEFPALGFTKQQLDLLERHIRRPYGMVLVTGPTGSGKTTTLYSAISAIRSPELNITTIEDPVEYRLDGITQTQVKPEIDLTFANALRTILRQDPNVVLVGEIRDTETAELAIRASLTGHLVFSTLHTNDAATAATRLTDMGVEPFLVASSLTLVLAQRLVRKSCPYCLEPYTPPPELTGWAQKNGAEQVRWSRSTGCYRCNNRGFKGRIGIFELLPISESVRKSIQAKEDASQIRQQAIMEGMRPLALDGLDKAARGLTTLEEVFRETVA